MNRWFPLERWRTPFNAYNVGSYYSKVFFIIAKKKKSLDVPKKKKKNTFYTAENGEMKRARLHRRGILSAGVQI